eukprot:TRINITY_DN14231_c0_g1_i2.p1 TRINITY_DN14231_c0_g1~~TRINITY_DN14231_c0_g1_i2.p1  ORF type:complete len:283 (-),score=26.81 TRINITY_DN14231_c0_g1_i2:820-1668(-)
MVSVARESKADEKCAHSTTVLGEADWDRDWCRHGRVGFIVLSNDERGELEIPRYFPEGFAVHFARLPGSTEVTSESLYANFSNLRDCARRLAVSDMKVICFACTSASFLIGADKVNREILEGAREREMRSSVGNNVSAGTASYFAHQSEAACKTKDIIPTSMTECVLEALKRALWRNVPGGYQNDMMANPTRRIVILTPYLADINRTQVPTFESSIPGLKVVEIMGLDIDHSFAMHRPSSKALRRLAKEMFLRHNEAYKSSGARNSFTGMCADFTGQFLDVS